MNRQCPFYKPRQKVCEACIKCQKNGDVGNPKNLYEWHRDVAVHYCSTNNFKYCSVYNIALEKGWIPKKLVWSVS